MFQCICDCGNEVELRHSHLYGSRMFCTRSCPYRAHDAVSDLIGTKAGRWTITASVGLKLIGGRKRAFVRCKCECGTERDINNEMVRSGGSLSCGCLMIETNTVHKTVEAKITARRAASSKCARANPARVRANTIAYLSRLSRATPAWLTKEHWDEMNALYFKAREMTKETGIRHEVDHIHPLNGKTVCGLHVPWNLQILTQSENVAKSNIYAELHGDV